MRRTWIDFDLATSDLSDNAFRVMVYLRLHADKSGNCWPSLPKIAIETGRSERSVDFAIRELKSKQFLQSFNQGRGRYQFQMIERTSATSCAGKDSEQAQKTTETSATHCAGKEETGAKSEVNERKKCNERAQKVGGRSHIREQCIEQGIEQPPPPAHTHAREARSFVAMGDGGGGSPVICSPQVKAIEIIGKAEMQIENSKLVLGVTSLLEAGWTEEKILEALGNVKEYEKGGMIGNYYAFITKGRPQKKQPAEAPDKPKRITTKDGKKVLIDGEWLLAKTPYENMPAEPRVESKLGDEFNRFVHEIHGLKLDMDCRIQAEMDLLGIFDQASAGTIDAGQFKQQAASLIQKLKGAVA